MFRAALASLFLVFGLQIAAFAGSTNECQINYLTVHNEDPNNPWVQVAINGGWGDDYAFAIDGTPACDYMFSLLQDKLRSGAPGNNVIVITWDDVAKVQGHKKILSVKGKQQTN